MNTKNLKKRNWLYRLFNDLYEVHLIFDDRQEIYWLRYIKRIDNKQLKAVDENGHKIEFRSVEPFDYRIKKHY